MIYQNNGFTYKRDGYCVGKIITQKVIQSLGCIADVHAGHKNFNESILDNVINWILKNDALWFGGGDLIECSTKTSVGAGWAEQVMSPQEQIKYMTEKLKPISHLCIGLVQGNHEDRAFKQAGVNITEIIAYNLGVEFFGDELFAIIARDKEVTDRGKAYTLYACHTQTTNKNPGLAMNFMSREMDWMNCDIVCKAHGHDLGLSPPAMYVDIDCRNLAISEKYRWYWLVGHYLNRPNSYISKTSKPPKPLGTEVLYLNMDPSKPKLVSGELIK